MGLERRIEVVMDSTSTNINHFQETNMSDNWLDELLAGSPKASDGGDVNLSLRPSEIGETRFDRWGPNMRWQCCDTAPDLTLKQEHD